MRCGAAREASGVEAGRHRGGGGAAVQLRRRLGVRTAEAAQRGGNWDAAVENYRLAVQDAPGRPEYRIALERAMLPAARAHLAAAGDLSGALIEPAVLRAGP